MGESMTPKLSASTESIVAAAITNQADLDLMVQAYTAGREAAKCKLRGLPFATLVEMWDNLARPEHVRRQFWRGVDDGIPG